MRQEPVAQSRASAGTLHQSSDVIELNAGRDALCRPSEILQCGKSFIWYVHQRGVRVNGTERVVFRLCGLLAAQRVEQGALAHVRHADKAACPAVRTSCWPACARGGCAPGARTRDRAPKQRLHCQESTATEQDVSSTGMQQRHNVVTIETFRDQDVTWPPLITACGAPSVAAPVLLCFVERTFATVQLREICCVGHATCPVARTRVF